LSLIGKKDYFVGRKQVLIYDVNHRIIDENIAFKTWFGIFEFEKWDV